MGTQVVTFSAGRPRRTDVLSSVLTRVHVVTGLRQLAQTWSVDHAKPTASSACAVITSRLTANCVIRGMRGALPTPTLGHDVLMSRFTKSFNPVVLT